jgi:hypothetical protein
MKISSTHSRLIRGMISFRPSTSFFVGMNKVMLGFIFVSIQMSQQSSCAKGV